MVNEGDRVVDMSLGATNKITTQGVTSYYRQEYSNSNNIREENLLQMVLWKMVHFALFLVKISINFSPGYSTVFFSSQCTSLLYNNFKILLQKFQNFCTMF